MFKLIVTFARRSFLCPWTLNLLLVVSKLTKENIITLYRDDPCTTFFLVYCNSFNVLFRAIEVTSKNSREMFCKVKTNFSNLQIIL